MSDLLLQPEQLRSYLEQIRLLETDSYILNQLHQKLQNSFLPEPQRMYIREPTFHLSEPEPPGEMRGVTGKDIAKSTLSGILYGGPLGLVFGARVAKDIIREEHEKKVIEYNKNLQYYNQQKQIYEQALAQYHSSVEQENLRMARKTTEIKSYNAMIANQQQQVLRNKAQTEAALAKLYDANILYPAYRGLLPVARFCEYLDSGLRTKLTGADGMYDLYEQELRSQAITNSMERVRQEVSNLKSGIYAMADQMNRIAQNQRNLLEAIERNNAYVENVGSQMTQLAQKTAASLDRLGQQNEKMLQAAEWTAYSAACTERSTHALAELEQMRYVHHIY